ncbi:hypothetical protein NEAUS04_0423 [Nematocida ausubeli]|uniref:Mitochondrial import inner membrane translocase subunit n=1 Tax=Nematocida ausubeli (strain ATCC PRA-371 / ERTm2) TaxID=1913371 RepID=H8ZBR6_NEMA1|nr:uncharacterized protein NESG_01136 [Nematocida ausubeli]EHY66319.1 hypothetical protein NERG_01015 [Nematocida ausubeli]KAI5138157.1 hypothetical protein NEAUS07_2295 [Nematocida ausubeli]KAI5150901.1 hypothetical protein NEAUS05_2330 [Nematocida ausubeli]KAI5161309.1 hypothetical protein NEAUS04_0423 [Nematocida ausubeli]KFG26024.1 hypothetical protein NESG_01136 [Nematocida ausubeli]
MLTSVWRWVSRQNTAQEDLKMFFEETTNMCFDECVKASKYQFMGKPAGSLSKKEQACVKSCTLKKIKLFLEVEDAILKKVHPIK